MISLKAAIATAAVLVGTLALPSAAMACKTCGTSTSSGGSTGSTGSTGGTDVPAPAAFALFGIGAGILAAKRRRRAA